VDGDSAVHAGREGQRVVLASDQSARLSEILGAVHYLRELCGSWAGEFDHLDINRRPYLFPDWTHTNAILYSADDGNLIISIRHQNWLVKVDYANGMGAGYHLAARL
jgi:hypothetical protein